ncbi:hypothetical protein O59_000947 [Cellvibrio sp. BR]|nr:hypothetical protein O59_000947 [Cellvibrio sp. BR]
MADTVDPASGLEGGVGKAVEGSVGHLEAYNDYKKGNYCCSVGMSNTAEI